MREARPSASAPSRWVSVRRRRSPDDKGSEVIVENLARFRFVSLTNILHRTLEPLREFFDPMFFTSQQSCLLQASPWVSTMTRELRWLSGSKRLEAGGASIRFK